LTWSRNDDDEPDWRGQLAIYQNDAWVEDYFREFSEASRREYRPYVVWARRDYQGRYINIENRNRKSYQAVTESQKNLSLYIFGGSTTWGTGARDEFTIPSYLAKFAEQDGIPLRVTNFGETAYVNWQNVIRMAEICAEGEIPDFVVFYIGANDMFAKIQSPDLSRPHLNFELMKRRFEAGGRSRVVSKWIKDNSAVHKIGRKLGEWIKGESEAEKTLQETVAARPQIVGEMARDLVSMLQENASFVRQLGAACGFEPWYFWQPVSYTKTTLSAEERSHPSIEFGTLPRDLYRAATREIQGQRFAIDVSDAFDSQDQTIYIDWAHVTELGNEIVSRRIYDHIKPAITAKLATLRLRTLADEHSGN
jgi:lysophospholipase L1-like esterase